MTATGPEAVPDEVVHFAATWFRVGTVLRQRCGWCGTMLVDVDLARVAQPVEQTAEHHVDPDDPRCGYPTWPDGGLVAHDGAAWWYVEVGPDDPLPAGSCANLPHDATA